jgi:hypothetical protein
MPREVARETRTFFDVPVRSSWPLVMSTVFSLHQQMIRTENNNAELWQQAESKTQAR